MRRFILAFVLAAALGACAPDRPDCRVGAAVELAQLFFGRDVPGRAPVTDDEWRDFLDAEVTRRFPDGFTVFDAAGQWRERASGRIVREPAKMIQVIAAPGAAFGDELAAVAAAYKRRFAQESVGIVIAPGCAAF